MRTERIACSSTSAACATTCGTAGDADAPKLFLLHGWMDVSASFQFLVDALARDWDVYAPGLARLRPDRLGGLGLLLVSRTTSPTSTCCSIASSPDAPVNADRPQPGRQRRRPVRGRAPGARRAPGQPGRLRHAGDASPSRRRSATRAGWTSCTRRSGLRPYASFGELADRLQKNNPRLTRERARVPGAALGQASAGRARRAAQRSGAQARQRRCSTGWTRRAPAGRASPRRCSGSTRPSRRRVTRMQPERREAARRAARGVQGPALRRRCRTRATCCTTTSPKRWRA